VAIAHLRPKWTSISPTFQELESGNLTAPSPALGEEAELARLRHIIANPAGDAEDRGAACLAIVTDGEECLTAGKPV
jgi:hypothetical protein